MDGCREGTHWEVINRELKSPVMFNMHMWCEKVYYFTTMTLNEKEYFLVKEKYLNI